MSAPGPEAVADWLHRGTLLFRRLTDTVPAHALAEPSLLPGWTRAHVVAHVARNADALVNLLTWARTGVETLMYPSRERRDADIEAGAAWPADRLRPDLHAACERFAEAVRTMPADRWSYTVTSAQGRPIPAREAPWMRVRELWIHAVDLDSGIGFAELPADLVDALLTDVAAKLGSAPGAVPVRLAATDREGVWSLGPDAGAAAVPAVHGSAAELLGWLAGRTQGKELLVLGDGGAGSLPPLPRWL
ncbi:maleylpyruvate isomerase family mycothiol-dependent enzyme [Allonocardiopsis opalescens]|uniref:maleylpyruvate isomerase family mycothiol-dependent enzyme n=1 Tax=Allonocardiopsis opalescens TaxID=1144618 RepID=UPI0014731EF3|nr:maleylpyruvate isomerase family mycothiol-dependent enzyme [Allonocardiopsis opalescens]